MLSYRTAPISLLSPRAKQWQGLWVRQGLQVREEARVRMPQVRMEYHMYQEVQLRNDPQVRKEL
jgi:hypothetical protein